MPMNDLYRYIKSGSLYWGVDRGRAVWTSNQRHALGVRETEAERIVEALRGTKVNARHVDRGIAGTLATCHFNLNEGGWSVADYTGPNAFGKIVCHADQLTMEEVVFVVNEAGHNRCLQEGRRNVHAWVVGKICSLDIPITNTKGTQEVTFNPYRLPHFHMRDNDSYVDKANVALFCEGGKLYCRGVICR